MDWDYVQGFFGGEGQIHGTIVFYNKHRRVLLEIKGFLSTHGIKSRICKRPEDWKEKQAAYADLDIENIADQYYLTIRKHDALPLRLKLLEKRWKPNSQGLKVFSTC